MTPIIRPTLNLLYVLDTSAEMAGKPIELLNRAVRPTLYVAAEQRVIGIRIKVSVMEFNSTYRWITRHGPEDLDYFIFDPLQARGQCNMGAALSELDDKLSKNGFLNGDGNLIPVIVFMGSGHSTDDFEPSFERLRHNKYFQHATRVAFPIGKNPDKETLARLTGSSEMVIRTDRLIVFADALSYSCYPPSLSYDSFIDDLWETYVPEDSRGTHPLALTRQMVLGQIKGSLGKGVSHGTLTDALARALLERGEDALRDSHLFLSFVLDYADYDSTSVRVLEHVCDEFLLAPYVRQLKGELDATQAAAQASRYLERECLIQPKVAQDVAQEIADAVVAHRSHVI